MVGNSTAENAFQKAARPAAFTHPVEDLTECMRLRETEQPSPFDGSPAYERFFQEISRALHRTSRRHVLLLREKGVGEQTALLELARRGVVGQPPFLRGKRFVLIDCRYCGVDHARHIIEAILKQSELNPETVLCLDGFANLLRACSAAEPNYSALLSVLWRSAVRVIGIVSPREFEDCIVSDTVLCDLFSTVSLTEPDLEVAKTLVRYFANGLEHQYRLRIDDSAIARAVILSDSYIMNEQLPYKAVKVLHALCEDFDYNRSECGAPDAQVTETDVLNKISQLSGVPLATLSGVGEAVDYRKAFSEVIFGQEHALNEVATELGLIKAGMVDGGKPASVIMFIGQTGTGKTELAKALAKIYSSSKRLKTFTLGNFSEPHSVSGIIGVPAGYVGHDQGGRLINELNADPYGVFLLDEADKSASRRYAALSQPL